MDGPMEFEAAYGRSYRFNWRRSNISERLFVERHERRFQLGPVDTDADTFVVR